uniref:Endonuclease n=1 Tax=Tetrahymena thermophila TaxID=5911 RepID=Q8WRA3_TETTH|nr:endonuclease [Tetrahymena thermophila]
MGNNLSRDQYYQKEEWKQIIDYPNYFVSNLGRVYNKKKQQFLKSVNGQTNGGYLIFNLRKQGKTKTFQLHRVLAQHFIPNPNNYTCIDHINQNRKDNSLSNLRWCDYSKNLYNRGKTKGLSSKYKGVYWYQSKNKWQAYINFEKKRFHLGYFQTEKEAAQKYNEYALKYHREFACLNVIED